MKHSLTDTHYGSNLDLCQIRAEEDNIAAGVRKGDYGGFVTNDQNLSQDGSCWIGPGVILMDTSKVTDNAIVTGRVLISEDTIIRGNAIVQGTLFNLSRICRTSRVTGSSKLFLNSASIAASFISGSCEIHGHCDIVESWVSGSARITGSNLRRSKVCGLTDVIDSDCEFAEISGSATCSGARLTGTDKAYAKVSENMRVIGHVYCDLSKDVAASIYAQTLQCPVNGKVILYKSVFKTSARPSGEPRYLSLYDPSFAYEIGKVARARNFNPSAEASCAGGLHCSHLRYWDGNGGNAYIAVEVDLADVVAVQAGKVRCKKLKVLGEVEV